MTIGATKNASDPWLRYRVFDVNGTGILNRYVLVEWVADPSLFAGNRAYSNAWPYDAATQALATVYLTAVPAYLYVPDESWDLLSANRVLWHRLSFGPSPTPSAQWTVYPPGTLTINHPPTASAGPAEVHALDPNDRLIDPVVLDATGSVDEDMSPALGAYRDPGPLQFRWELRTAQGQLPWETSNYGQANAMVLLAGTPVPVSAMGPYTFRVEVRDTDVPLASSRSGIGYDEVQHTIRRFGGGIFVYSPTGSAPRTFQFAQDLDVPITYRLDPNLVANPAFGGGFWVQLEILESVSSAPVMTRIEPLPPTTTEGHFHWDGVFDDGTMPASGQQFDVVVRLLDWDGQPVSIPGRMTQDRQVAAIRLNVTTVMINPGAPTAVSLDEMLAGTAQLTLPLDSDVSPGAAIPDRLTLQIRDDQGAMVGSVVIPTPAGAPPSITWQGGLGGGPPLTIPGLYSFRVLAQRGAQVLSRSNDHAVKVVRVRITVASPGQSIVGASTVHAIVAAGPTMPAIAVNVDALGVPAAELPAVTREARLELAYAEGNRADLLRLPGPGVGGFAIIPPGAAPWTPVWGAEFRGGDLVVHARVTVDGVRVVGHTAAAGHRIWGQNPTKATIRAALGNNRFVVTGWRESRWTQFSTSTNVAVLSIYQPGPLTVLRAPDNGFGIGQITAAPANRDLWSWQANVDSCVARATAFRANAMEYEAQVRLGLPWNARTGGDPPNEKVAFPAAPAFTGDQLDLEMWSRYNSNFRYHDFNPATGTWVRRLAVGADANTGLPYADDCLARRVVLDGGGILPGW